MLHTVKVEKSVGMILCHDMTRIIKGEFKGTLFKKGHIIQKKDIPEFLKIGKESIYVMELVPGEVHEDDAGIRLGKAAAGQGIICSEPKESRVNLIAETDGLLKINVDALDRINDMEDIVLSTLHNNSIVNKGQLVAGTKVIPLSISESIVLRAESICTEEGWVIKVLPFIRTQIGVVVTGNEIYKNRIKDEFGVAMKEKAEALGSTVLRIQYAPDDASIIAGEINKMIEDGSRMVLVTGGMSVDPDDVTPSAIKLSGATTEIYGTPVLPGAMFMLAYQNNIPVLGIPACGMFFKTTVLDIILPRLLAGERVTRKEICKLGHGGLCRSCEKCTFPDCSFGK